MKIYVDARLAWGSGIGRYVSSILPEIAESRRGWNFIVGISNDNQHPSIADLSKHENIEFLRTDIAPFSVGEQLNLFRLVGKKVDLSWFTNYWMPFRWPGRFVVTVHDMLHLNAKLFPCSKPKRALSKLMFGNIARRANGVIFVSDFSQDEFTRYCGVPKSSEVIHHGVDHLQNVASAGATKGKIALTVGAPKQHKNLEFLLSVWQQADIPQDWKLVVVTPGDALRSQTSISQADDGNNQIEFKSSLPQSELTSLYQQASVYLFPTLYEGFGFPLLEAALSECRIVASNIPPIVEIGRGMDIDLIDTENTLGWVRAIEENLNTVENKAPFVSAKSNRLIAEKFTWKKSALKTADFLVSL